jgi:hypothetical protein
MKCATFAPQGSIQRSGSRIQIIVQLAEPLDALPSAGEDDGRIAGPLPERG